ncbi:MAG: hypothetical protein AB7O96_04520 [Pseudobdellovibrionaceae bacterium]
MYKIIASLLLLVSIQTQAQVASSYFFDIIPVENPAALLTSSEASRVAIRASNAKGEHKIEDYKQEAFDISSTEGVITHLDQNYSVQFAYIPSAVWKVEEFAEYNPLEYEKIQNRMVLNVSSNSGNFAFGAGYEMRNEEVPGNKDSQQRIRAGALFGFENNVLLGAYAHHITDKGDFKETRAWIESGLGLGWVGKLDSFDLRVEGSFSKSPEIFQETNSANNPNYQRSWQQTRLGGDVLYSLSTFGLSFGAESKTRTYRALEAGNKEAETEQQLRRGGHFMKDMLSIFLSQSTPRSKMGLHDTKITSTDLLLVFSLGQKSDSLMRKF